MQCIQSRQISIERELLIVPKPDCIDRLNSLRFTENFRKAIKVYFNLITHSLLWFVYCCCDSDICEIHLRFRLYWLKAFDFYETIYFMLFSHKASITKWLNIIYCIKYVDSKNWTKPVRMCLWKNLLCWTISCWPGRLWEFFQQI